MAYKDLRDFIARLEDQDEIIHIAEEVLPEPDVGAIGRATCDLEGPAIVCERIRGYEIPLALRKDIRFLTDVTFSRYTDRQEFAPQGLLGGKEGHKGRLVLNPGTPQEERLKSKGVSPLRKGDVLSIRLPGSGGYGDPKERDPERVRWDVLNGKISLELAREDYGMVRGEDLKVV